MAIIYEITVRTGTYLKDGQEKTSYQRIGDVVETKKGPMLKIHTMPIMEGGWSGWAYLFEPSTDSNRSPVKKASVPFGEFIDDQIPF
jgi:hypothetical protein